jgi:hypothetical protein
VSSATELTAVLARPVLVQERLRGWRRSGWSSGRRRGPIRGCRQWGARTRHSGGRATSCPRAFQQHQDVVTVLGVAWQWRVGMKVGTGKSRTDRRRIPCKPIEYRIIRKKRNREKIREKSA